MREFIGRTFLASTSNFDLDVSIYVSAISSLFIAETLIQKCKGLISGEIPLYHSIKGFGFDSFECLFLLGIANSKQSNLVLILALSAKTNFTNFFIIIYTFQQTFLMFFINFKRQGCIFFKITNNISFLRSFCVF